MKWTTKFNIALVVWTIGLVAAQTAVDTGYKPLMIIAGLLLGFSCNALALLFGKRLGNEN